MRGLLSPREPEKTGVPGKITKVPTFMEDQLRVVVLGTV
jgi:hypothetical protein